MRKAYEYALYEHVTVLLRSGAIHLVSSGKSEVIRLFRATRIRNFRIVLLGSLVAHTGTWIHRLAQDWLVIDLTEGSASALGMVAALQFLPLPLFGLLAGAAADRWSKRWVLATATVFQLLVSVMIGALVLTDRISLPSLAVLSFLFGVGTAFELPSRQSFVTELVGRDDISNAVSLNSLSFNVARVAGPVAAGMLIATVWHSVGPLYIVHALTTFSTLASLAMLRESEFFDRSAARVRGSIVDGLRYVKARPDLTFVVIVAAFAGLFGLNFQVLIAMLARRDLDLGADGLGIMSSLFAIGGVLGALASAGFSRARLRHLAGSATIFGVLIVLAAFAPNAAVFGVVVLPLGFFALAVLTSSNALMQASASAAMRGRVMSIYVVVIFLGTPVGAPAIGALAEWLGAPTAIAMGGFALVAVTVVSAAVTGRQLGSTRRGAASSASRLFSWPAGRRGGGTSAL